MDFKNFPSPRPIGVNDVSDLMSSLQEHQHRQANPVIRASENIRKYIETFEASLDPDHEVALRIASFGGVVTFHAETIGFAKPDLITFIGVTPEGDRVQLVQHFSQLSFLLKAVKKTQAEARRIGFI